MQGPAYDVLPQALERDTQLQQSCHARQHVRDLRYVAENAGAKDRAALTPILAGRCSALARAAMDQYYQTLQSADIPSAGLAIPGA